MSVWSVVGEGDSASIKLATYKNPNIFFLSQNFLKKYPKKSKLLENAENNVFSPLVHTTNQNIGPINS